KAVESAGADTAYVAMEDLVAVLGQDDPGGFTAVLRVEQAYLDLLGMSGKQREVGAFLIERYAERIGASLGETMGWHGVWRFLSRSRRGPTPGRTAISRGRGAIDMPVPTALRATLPKPGTSIAFGEKAGRASDASNGRSPLRERLHDSIHANSGRRGGGLVRRARGAGAGGRAGADEPRRGTGLSRRPGRGARPARARTEPCNRAGRIRGRDRGPGLSARLGQCRPARLRRVRDRQGPRI